MLHGPDYQHGATAVRTDSTVVCRWYCVHTYTHAHTHDWQMCLEPPSVATNLLTDGFLSTPHSALCYNLQSSPQWDKWPDSKSPGSSMSAAKATGPNAFPPPKGES